jgi:predicted acetyltransferase
MDNDALALIEPTEELRDEYIAFLEDFVAAGETRMQEQLDAARRDFAAYVRLRRDWAAGRNLRPGYVPATEFWLVRGRTVIAGSNLRHRLTAALEDFGGHIGYSVRPTERGKGYGTRLLALTLEKARTLGLRRVLLTCHRDNAASARVMEKNGAVLASESLSPRAGRISRRYWIDLTAADAGGQPRART